MGLRGDSLFYAAPAFYALGNALHPIRLRLPSHSAFAAFWLRAWAMPYSFLSARLASVASEWQMAWNSGTPPFLGRTTICSPSGKLACCKRKASRIKRFHRLRVGACPTFLDMLNPSWLAAGLRWACSTSVWSATTIPRRNRLANTRLLLIRMPAVKRPDVPDVRKMTVWQRAGRPDFLPVDRLLPLRPRPVERVLPEDAVTDGVLVQGAKMLDCSPRSLI